MIDVLTIAGSPAYPSRSSAVLAYARRFLEKHGLVTDALSIRDLDPSELLTARFDGASVRAGLAKVQAARAILIATPVYKAAYSGVLKAFLDLLPQDGLANKIIYPLVTAGSANHLLVIDYALKPVLTALGAQHVLKGLYIQDAQLQQQEGEVVAFDAEIEQRLQVTLLALVTTLGPSTVVKPAYTGNNTSALASVPVAPLVSHPNTSHLHNGAEHKLVNKLALTPVPVP
jgi:FMN reductase